MSWTSEWGNGTAAGKLTLMVPYGFWFFGLGGDSTSRADIKVEGINYFFDTLLFAGVILALARRHPTHGLSHTEPCRMVAAHRNLNFVLSLL
jgi:hypothetical protein